jgi:hypothetical protein
MEKARQTGMMHVLRGMLATLAGACAWGRVDLAAAVELRYGAEYSGEYSTNVGRNDTGIGRTLMDEQSDWINTTVLHIDIADSAESLGLAGQRILSGSSRGIDFTGAAISIGETGRGFGLERTKKIDALISARMTYEHYVKGTFDDQLLFGLDALSTLTIRPKWFSWTFEDRFGQTPITRQIAITPNNRQDFNVLSTGPNFTFRFGPQHTLELEGRYGRDMFFGGDSSVVPTDSQADSQRYIGAMRWTYGWSPSLLFSVNAKGEGVDFDSTPPRAFDRLRFLVGIVAARSRSNFLLNVGWSHTTHREDGSAPSESEPIGRLEWIYRLTSGSRVGVSVSAEPTDTASELLSITADKPRDPEGFVGEAVVPDTIFEKQSQIFYEHVRPSIGGRISILLNERDYSNSNELDERSYGGLLEFNYRLSALWEARCNVGYTVRDFRNTDRTDRDTGIGVRLLYHAPRNITVSLRAAWNNQFSTDPTAEFSEAIAGLTIGYAR